jgi:hypothetical protein
MSSLPSYLESVVDEAMEYLDTDSVSPAGAAVEIAAQQDHLYSSLNRGDRRDNLKVLMDIRDHHGFCADELDTYRRDVGSGATADDFGSATIEAIVRRSLEDLVHTQLTERLQVDDAE